MDPSLLSSARIRIAVPSAEKNNVGEGTVPSPVRVLFTDKAPAPTAKENASDECL